MEFGPDVSSIPEDHSKEAGIEVLIPQIKLRLLELSSDGNILLVNLSSSSVEQFSLGHGDLVWLIAGSGTEVILDIQGTSNLVNIIADTVKVTSIGFTSNGYAVGTLESG